MNKKTIIEAAESAGFYYHESFEYQSFAPGISIKPEGFKYGLEEIPFHKIREMLEFACKAEKKRITEKYKEKLQKLKSENKELQAMVK